MKTIKLIQNLVEQELKEFTGPNGAAPYRQPAADTANEPSEPTEVDDLYKLAIKARLATESLVAALDHPIYDQAFEAAFKATAALRDALNALENVGAEPEPEDRVVAPPKEEQPLGAGFGVKHMPMTHTGDNV